MKKFTLIELLVVIAIVALLMTLLIPSMAKAREQAKIAVCLSNVSQLGKSCLVYSKDHNNRFPPPGHSVNSGAVWTYSLNVEVADTLDLYKSSADSEGSIYDCPSNERAPRGEKTVSGVKLFLIDQYSILTNLEDFSGASFLGDSSPRFAGEDGVLVSESVIWWNSLGESEWTSNHATGDRGTNWTQLKFSPVGYNQCERDGSAKWRRISSLMMSQPKSKINGYWQYWRED